MATTYRKAWRHRCKLSAGCHWRLRAAALLQVDELRNYLERCGVVPSPGDAGTPPKVLQEVVCRTGEAMASCMQALNLGGLKLQALMDAIETRCRPSRASFSCV